jgi:hypothetical protein
MFTNTLLAAIVISPAAPPENSDVRDSVKNGLKWLAEQQNRNGSWTATANTYPTAITGFAGVALLMEGSTPKHGQFSTHIRAAINWYEKNAQENGLLVPVDSVSEQGRYILGHGFGMLFLACAYDTDDDEPRRKRVAKLLEAAVLFAARAQTTKGGWGYVSAGDANDFDEANSTITTIQALYATQKAGITVPTQVIDKARKYLLASTNKEGGIVYSLANGASPTQGRPVLTAGAAACALMVEGQHPEPLARWLAFSNKNLIPLRLKGGDYGALYHHYYMARAVNALGEAGHRALDSQAKDADIVKWSVYRAKVFPALKAMQEPNGSWADASIGPVYSTSLALTILQLDNNYLPAFSK